MCGSRVVDGWLFFRGAVVAGRALSAPGATGHHHGEGIEAGQIGDDKDTYT
ncbi:hypothetical protein AB0O75_05030 [Streptomyces sp. NPDC088921]|uniref:hypothetical protein n=1 Tax=unclassified Streptomyces TaxID=2593676 RepID=UPI003447AC09